MFQLFKLDLVGKFNYFKTNKFVLNSSLDDNINIKFKVPSN